MKTKDCICVVAFLVVSVATASEFTAASSVGNITPKGGVACYEGEEPDDDFCHLFSGNKFLSSVAGSFWNLATQANDEYRFGKLYKLRKKQDRILVKAYDTLHPNQQFTEKEKAYRMVEELERALDVEGARTTGEMNEGISMMYIFSRYKVIALSNEVLQQDGKFKAELEAWQDLQELLDGICGSITSLFWFDGSGELGAVMGTYKDICQCRVNDLLRLSGKMETEYKASVLPLDDMRGKLMKKVEEVTTEVSSPEQMKGELRELSTDRYRALWEEMQASKDRLMQTWDKWIQVRRNLSNSNSMVSAAKLADELIKIVESCNL